MSQQPPYEPPQGGQQPNQGQPWHQQPTQGDNTTPWGQPGIPPGQTNWNQQPSNQPQWNSMPPQQPFDQPQWNQQQAQFQYQQPPQPPLPPRHTLWQRYRRSRPAKIISVLVLVLFIASILIAVLHITPSNPGGIFGGGGTATPGPGTVVTQPNGPGDVKVDFGGRQNHAYPIPTTFMGIGGLGISHVINAAAPYLPQANLKLTRFGDFVPTIFPTEVSATNPALQQWGKVDSILSVIQQNNLQPILIVNYSPTWLQPQNQNPPLPNYCLTNAAKTDPAHVKPTFIENRQDIGDQKWGQLAAQVVAHIDKNFPNLHPLYELWNEPDGTAYWCKQDGDPNANHERLAEYKALYAAAAPMMKQQAQQDGMQIKVGGPALAFISARASLWIPSLVDDPTTAPYVDFISYHEYTDAKSWTQLIAKTQDPKVGYIGEYQLVASIVHAGHQPNAQSTPIYIDEYNGNSCVPNVCRNDPSYAPVWNSLFITDLLNTVTTHVSNKGLATSIPAGTVYFTWSAPPGHFCMFGQINANLDCSPGPDAQAYPQYYAYKLIGGADYLNITNNGYVASSVFSDKSGVYVAGFYTQNHDSILIVNTTGQAFTNLNVLATNPGETTMTGKLFSLNKDNLHIASQPIQLFQENDGVGASITVPAYGTVAISF